MTFGGKKSSRVFMDAMLKYLLCILSFHLRGRGHIDLDADPLASVSHFLICTISCEPVAGVLPNFHEYIIGT